MRIGFCFSFSWGDVSIYTLLGDTLKVKVQAYSCHNVEAVIKKEAKFVASRPM